MTFKRKLIDAATSALCRAKKGRRVGPGAASGPVKVNLGSALGVVPGWINVDGSLNAFIAGWPRWAHRVFYAVTGSKAYYGFEEYHALLRDHRFVHHNLEHGVPLVDACADVVYSSHFLEHLDKTRGANLVRESFRVLKPSGLIRLAVPDLAFALSLYDRGEKKRMLENYFFVDMDESYFARHKYMYDFDLLKELMESHGFRGVERRRFREGEMPDVEKLDNRPEETLFVEARKPA